MRRLRVSRTALIFGGGLLLFLGVASVSSLVLEARALEVVGAVASALCFVWLVYFYLLFLFKGKY